ncbi:hypothetical protein FOCC_FOCC014888 [Frankliniella occidentalis]|nr:hypothetical protein FOCC_FOCC014888 [Frankliniella occidentalis]
MMASAALLDAAATAPASSGPGPGPGQGLGPGQGPNGLGHSFTKKTYHRPTYCHHCGDMLWGLIGQGYSCEEPGCPLLVGAVAPQEKVLQLCEYFVHPECMDLAVADCKENATYLPGKDLSMVHHTHHWREGNLPANSKCCVCRKTCWSAECLAGTRCEWCGLTSHASCQKSIPEECNFGQFQPIYLPPHAVSIPRTEVPMEAIIGVQVRRKDTLSCEFVLV